MTDKLDHYDRYFLSYSGSQLPLNLVGALEAEEIENRNTYFGACLDESGQVVLIHKIVYGEVELAHSYQYSLAGKIFKAWIIDDEGEQHELTFDSNGKVIIGKQSCL